MVFRRKPTTEGKIECSSTKATYSWRYFPVLLRIFVCVAAVNDKGAPLRQRVSEEIFPILCWKLEEPPTPPSTKANKPTNQIQSCSSPSQGTKEQQEEKEKGGKLWPQTNPGTNLYPRCLYMWSELEKELHVETIVWSRPINLRPQKTSAKFFFHEQKL